MKKGQHKMDKSFLLWCFCCHYCEGDIPLYLPWWQYMTNSKSNTVNFWVWFWQFLTRGLIWHLSQSSVRPSIYFSLIVKSCSNLFLEPTSTMQLGYSFLLKETTGAFDGARTHDPHITSQTCNPLHHVHRPMRWQWSVLATAPSVLILCSFNCHSF